ncbi:MAG TPA: mannose-6-phosphate isomerase, class I [Jatrophihabitantaceae bacterium]|nr:mannose-6-phosphate isomerase, class I [Jatrophihabitantaceae bacterium]
MRLPSVFAVEGVPRRYAWGSRTAIQHILGVEPDGRPLAELWFGAHPDDPSELPAHGIDLQAAIDANPSGLLGARVAERFGGSLPFLVKILAADVALSIQVHPTLEQARAGYAAEVARGIARDAPDRNYRDPNHKPELLCALTEFEALCGFRPVEQALQVVDALAIAELAETRRLLAAPDGIRAAFTHLLTAQDATAIARAVAGAAAHSHDDPVVADALRVVALLQHDFPDDIGIALSLLLNYVHLAPGEAIFLAAGNVHCYLRGTAVEIMANSDNVLRCALTPKYVDVDEVLATADFTPLDDPRCDAEDDGFGPSFDVPVADFALSIIDLDAFKGSCAVGVPGPHLVLCVEEPVEVSAGEGAPLVLRPGTAAFVSHAPDGRAFTVRGSGRVFCTSVGH